MLHRNDSVRFMCHSRRALPKSGNLAAPVLINETQRHVVRIPRKLPLPAISMRPNEDHGNERIAKT